MSDNNFGWKEIVGGCFLIACVMICVLCGMYLVYAGDTARQDVIKWKLKAENGPDGAWIDVDGHAVAVRSNTEGKDGVKIIEYIHDWPKNEPAPPPKISLTDPRWQGKVVERDGKLVLEGCEAEQPRQPNADEHKYQIELRPICPYSQSSCLQYSGDVEQIPKPADPKVSEESRP